VRTTVCRLDELGPAEVDRWSRLQRGTPALHSPFLRPEFALAVGRRRPDARVAVVEDGGEIVAFFPFERSRSGIGRALAYDVSDYQGVIHAPGFDWHGPELLKACGLAVWEFDHLVGEQVDRFAPRELERRASPVIDLSEGWDAWYAGRRAVSRSRMKKARSHERRLTDQVGPVRVELETADEARLDLLLRWKSAQYVRTGRRDRFRQDWLVAAVRELFRRPTPEFSLVLSTMLVDERPASLYLGLRSGEVFAGWFPAYDTDLAPYSPGLVHLIALARVAAQDGVRTFDLGAGEASYKETLKSGDAEVARGVVRRPTVLAAVRRAQRAPVEAALAFTLARPRLRSAARRTLGTVGGVRSRLGR
jgi:CelD/BcsL family acetyltransferase involved in cellulose biosynthesis